MIKRSASRSFATFLKAANSSPALGSGVATGMPAADGDHNAAILRALAEAPLGFAAIRERTGLPVTALMTALASLQSFGLVRAEDGTYAITEEGRRTLAAAS